MMDYHLLIYYFMQEKGCCFLRTTTKQTKSLKNKLEVFLRMASPALSNFLSPSWPPRPFNGLDALVQNSSMPLLPCPQRPPSLRVPQHAVSAS